MNNKTFENMHRINRIINETNGLYHQTALKLNMSDSAMFVLYMIYDKRGKCPLNEINSLGICKQTINSAIRKLENDGILYLEQYKGKTKIAILTETGKSYAQKTVARLFLAEESSFDNWTEEEIETYIQLSEKYLETLKEQIGAL